jgi:hypothetical protein
MSVHPHLEDLHHTTPCASCGAYWVLQDDGSYLMRHDEDCAYVAEAMQPDDEPDDDQTHEDFNEIFGSDR